jgi:A/G-specific adenine glycosylase
MLQQTRVDSTIRFFKDWMKHFPSISVLAEATQQEVLSAWEGLGYYSRARNMHKTATLLMANYDGKLPSSYNELKKLPGIGPYTAAAIASIAFGHDAAAVDSNVRRVLARLFDISEPVGSRATQALFQKLADQNLPPGHAGIYNQAMMDLGATICTPREPDCLNCPLKNQCLAYKKGNQSERPVFPPKAKIPLRVQVTGLIENKGRVLISRRPDNGLLGGMWEFPGSSDCDEENTAACLQRAVKERLGLNILTLEPFGVYKHAYTHFRVNMHAYLCKLPVSNGAEKITRSDTIWVRLEELDHYPMGRITRKISNKYISWKTN